MRVLDLSQGVAGAYCTKLLVDAWADVVKIEPEGGDALRSRTAHGIKLASRDGALFQYLCASKHCITGNLDDALTLARAVDLVVEDLGPGGVDVAALRASNPRLVVVSISPFGHSGPRAHDPATEFTLQAWCGSLAARGEPDRPPLQAGGAMGEWATGAQAAVAGLAAWMTANATGDGEHVDVSMLEVMVRTYHPAGLIEHQLGLPWRGRYTQVPSIVPTSDGWVGLHVMTRQHYEDLMNLVGQPHLAGDDGWEMMARFARRREVVAAVRHWTTQHTTEEVIELFSAVRFPATHFGSGDTIPNLDHFRANGVFVMNPSAGFVQPRVPYRMGDYAARPFAPAPKLGDNEPLVWEPVERGVSAPGSISLPLAGVRIVDLTAFWAGPESTDLLAALGADVIKVESPRRPDPMRTINVVRPEDPNWWEYNGFYHAVNRNKRDVTIDLARPEGLQVAKRLIATADIVIENMTPRALDSLGLGWDVIHDLNRRTILLRMPAYGLAGPWRDRRGFGPTMEQVTGMASVTGYSADEPIVTGGTCDAIAGAHAAFVALVALAQRGAGEGMLVELPMVETVLNVTAEVVIEKSAYGQTLTPLGNRSMTACPQGVYGSRGDDDWLAVSVVTPEQWQGLLDVIEAPAWLREAKLVDMEARRNVEDRVDDVVAAWAIERSAAGAAAELLAGGVPAAPVTRTYDLASVDQLVARGFLESVQHPRAGQLLHPGQGFRFASLDRPWIRDAPPTLGQHNHEVLSSIGLSDEEIAELQEQQVIADRVIDA
jgi:crotonobetainyl-CoA:carnitine CoA-transferase CaiB-like acyl-CoA transferase